MRKNHDTGNDPRSLVLAFPLAQSYADLGLAGYNKLASALEEAQKKGGDLSHEETVGGIASAMVLAFAAELFIKVLMYQRTGSYPRGHELRGLLDQLPVETRASVKSAYERFVAERRNVLTLNFEYFDGPPPPTGAPSLRGESFEEGIDCASQLFVKLRYLYEEVAAGFSAQIDFRHLLFLIEALRGEIARYQNGNLKLSWGNRREDRA